MYVFHFNACTCNNTSLISLSLSGGSDIYFLNFKNRDLPKGLLVGANPKTRFLQIDEDFHRVKHYGVDYELRRLEVGATSARGRHELTSSEGVHELTPRYLGFCDLGS